MPQSDQEIFQSARRELFSAVIGDVMDKMGLLQQFLPPAIVPLDRSMVVCGRAMTVLEADVFDESVAGLAQSALGASLRPDDGRARRPEARRSLHLHRRFAALRALGRTDERARQKCGAAGAVVDGYSRDTRGVLALGFPTFSHGSYAQDQGPRGKVIDFRIPIQIGQARIVPGDIVFGDLDGVCVVPRAAEQEVLARAFEKARKEKTVRKALEEGMPSKAAFEKYGIL